MTPDITYRFAVQYVWEDGHEPDPEIYWVGLDELVTLFDAVLSADSRDVARFHVGIITVSPHREMGVRLRGHHEPAWKRDVEQIELF